MRTAEVRPRFRSSQPFLAPALLFLILVLTAGLPLPAWAGSGQIIFSASTEEIWVDGRPEKLPAPPFFHGDYIMVPLRPLAKLLGGEVHWEAGEPDTIKVILGGRHAITHPGSRTVVLEGEETETQILPVPVQETRGILFVPAVFFHRVFEVPYARWAEGNAYLLGSSNRPPLAHFVVSQPVYAGQPVRYTVKAEDPEGDPIVEERWEGRQDIFSQPGSYTVTLQVKDARGSWSKPLSQLIHVLPDPANPQPGDLWAGGELSPTLTYEPPVRRTGPPLLFSNSPEYIKEPGILYQDEVEERARLYFWHAIEHPETFKVYVLAVNRSREEVELTVEREGYGGPSTNVFLVARQALAQYFMEAQPRTLTLKPGEAAVLNRIQPSACRHQVLHGILDVKATGKVDILFVAALASQKVLREYSRLPYLPADGVHARGTFGPADIEVELSLSGQETGELRLADGITDQFLPSLKPGASAPSLKGNYGAVYRIRVVPQQDTEAFLVPVSGLFAGTVLVDGRLVNVPREGFVRQGGQPVYLGRLKAKQAAEIVLVPPGGSYLPVKLVFDPREK
ncbi:MAG: hypothetical protein IMW96_00040 [Thermoanaerobacteraceae bacterium]|nr:hypothetical protein [Thermoanaerobacteraceae bacterium]